MENCLNFAWLSSTFPWCLESMCLLFLEHCLYVMLSGIGTSAEVSE